MCGFAAEIRFDGAPASIAAVERMMQRLVSRGPDSSGVFAQDGIAFGHRRLKIIDITTHAHQPMVDSHLGLSIAYNGAIYNYKQLREELKERGYQFFSTGDTELILKAYHAWGDECVERFNGMFAFVIAERDTGRVFAARDRLGIKPLYFADIEHGIRFASSLPALVASGGLNTAIDHAALNYYMTFHAVVPAPHTIVEGVRKMPPATTMVIEPGGDRRIHTYWALEFGPHDGDADRSEEEWQERVLDGLRAAVERRLVADVPVGILLSGGLDSSLITGLVHEAGHQGISTFSIGFEDVGQEEGNEFRYSDVIAEHFSTDHHKIVVPNHNLVDHLPACVAAMSEPMVSHDNVAFYLLSEQVSQYVKVVLSGQGADEVFAGYHWYPPMMRSNNPLDDYAKAFFDRDFDEYRAIINDRYVDGDAARAFVAERFNSPLAQRPLDKALHLDITTMLVDDPVKRLDNMSMAWGLEARVPFLDHELIELAARVPGELKARNGGKHILKEAARKVIPADVIDRPKGYFPVPALKYIQGPFLEFVKRVLNEPAARERALFRQEELDRYLSDPEAHITPLRGSKLWQAALLEAWLQERGL